MQNSFFWTIVLLLSCTGCNSQMIEKYPVQQTIFKIGSLPTGWYSEQDYDEHYLDKVQAIFSKRCITCHGCYEAPCQLNLQSYQGVRRGYNVMPIYNMKRLESMPITQMNEVYPLGKWRDLDFLPVVTHDEEPDSANQPQNWGSSLLKVLIEGGSQYNQPGFPLTSKLSELQSNFKDNNETQCTATPEQIITHFPENHNTWGVMSIADYFHTFAVNGTPSGTGMPFALPALSQAEITTLNTWLQNGAKGPSEQTMKQLQAPNHPEIIEKWENFLNTNSAQGRQAARYIYEHTYTAYLHFDESPGEYFRIARVTTMEDGSAGEIMTEFPYQSPTKRTPFVYRLKKITEARVQKKLIVWQVNDKRLARLKELFLGNWSTQPILEPQYDNSNPFAYFASIPAKIRSRFLIENADVIIGAMVQGAVCIGSGATYAIRDHFWVWFLDPNSDISVINPQLELPSWDTFSTGRWQMTEQQIADKKYTALFGQLWNKVQGLKYNVKAVKTALEYYEQTSQDDELYQKAYERQLRIWLKQQNRTGLNVNDIWDGHGDSAYGDEVNPNAWLNVTRHERSTTVQRGPEGGAPGSIWVLSFANFERIYYNLVAHYQPYGNLAMKLGSFRIMTYTRLEAEDLAISFLPIAARETIRHQYTKGVGWVARKLFFPAWSIKSLDSDNGTLPPRTTGTPELNMFYNQTKQAYLQQQGLNQEAAQLKAANAVAIYLVNIAKERLQAVSRVNFDPDAVSAAQQSWEESIQTALMHKTKITDEVQYPQYFPSISYLKINHPSGEAWVYSIIADKAYKSNFVPGTESLTREPNEDQLTLYRGFVGAYPNVFFEIDDNQRSTFIADITKINSETTWKRFVGQYGISRNSANFWTFFDWIQEWKAQSHPGVDPIMQGVIDVGQYDFFVSNK